MFSTIACIVLIGALLPASANGSPQSNGLGRNSRRQILPTPSLIVPLSASTSSTSTYDYWWPFPPATTPSAQTASLLSMPAETKSPDVDEILSITAIATPILLSSTAIGPDSAMTASSLEALSEDGSSTSSSLITITALPPLTSPLRHAQAISAYRQPANPSVFIPLFVILGLGVGFLFGWYGFGLWKRRRDAHPGAIVAGPKYEGINCEDVDDQCELSEKDTGESSAKVDDEEQLSQHPHLYKNGNEALEEITMTKQPGIHKTESAWSRVGSLVFQRAPLLSGLLNGYTRPEDNNENKTEEEHAEKHQSPYAPTVFSSVASSDEDDEDYEDARRFTNMQGTVQYRSIRRRLADKLQFQFSPGYGFARRKSKMRSKAREKTPELEEGVLLQDDALMVDSPAAPGKGSLRRTKTRSTGHGRAISDFSILPDDVQTPPRVYALKDPGVTPLSANTPQTTRTYSTPLRSGNNASFDDRYTPLPSRKSRSGRKLVSARSTRRRAEIMADSDTPPKYNMRTEVARRVLPTSPPLLNSPELESALFFSPSVNSASHSLNVSHSATREISRSRIPTHPEMDSQERGSPVRKGPLAARHSKNLLSKLQTAYVLDASPTRSQPYDGVLSPSPLRRSTARTSSSSPTKGGNSARDARYGRDRSSTLPSDQAPTFPKERYDARRTALEKVDAIIERSWSARLLQGSAAPSTQSNKGLQISNTNVSETKAVK